jgi:AraC-like DNA-binding protein
VEVIQKIHNYFILFAALQLFGFALFLFFTQRGKRKSNRILSFILFSVSSHLTGNVLHLNALNAILILALPPAIFLYTKSIVKDDFKIAKSDAFHLFPAVLYLLYSVINLLITGNMLAGKVIIPVIGLEVWVIYDVFTDTQLLIYSILSIQLMSDFRKRLKEQYSTIAKVNLNWLVAFIAIFCTAWFLGSIIFYLKRFEIINDVLYQVIAFTDVLVVFIFSNYIVFKGLDQPEIFKGTNEKPKYSGSILETEEKDRILNELLELMKKEKPYLSPAVSLSILADQLDISSKHLSQVINENLGRNFYDFINQYRVEEAKIKIQKNSNKTFLEILYDVGFNSKAVFNNSFKKHTGMTPREFKKVSLN